MEDYLNLWGITPNLRSSNFRDLLKGDIKTINILDRLIDTYPEWSTNGKLFLTKKTDPVKLLANFGKQLYKKHCLKIKTFFLFKNISEFFDTENLTQSKLKVELSNLTVILEVGAYKLTPYEQKVLVDILFTMNKLNKLYIISSRVNTETLAENLGVGICAILNNCKSIIIE